MMLGSSSSSSLSRRWGREEGPGGIAKWILLWAGPRRRGRLVRGFWDGIDDVAVCVGFTYDVMNYDLDCFSV